MKADSPASQTSCTVLQLTFQGASSSTDPKYFIYNSGISKFLNTECFSITYLVVKPDLTDMRQFMSHVYHFV